MADYNEPCNHSNDTCEALKIDWACDHEDGPCIPCICKGIRHLLAAKTRELEELKESCGDTGRRLISEESRCAELVEENASLRKLAEAYKKAAFSSQEMCKEVVGYLERLKKASWQMAEEVSPQNRENLIACLKRTP